MKIQVCIGSEYHSAEHRSAMVYVINLDGEQVPIYQALTPIKKPEWRLVGNKGRHGKWAIVEYEINPEATIYFKATANGKPAIEFEGVPDGNTDIEGYRYNNEICGWVVCTER